MPFAELERRSGTSKTTGNKLDFIIKSFELSKTQLEDLLMLFKDCDYLIVIKDPNFSLSKI